MEKLSYTGNKSYIVEKLIYNNEVTNTKVLSVKDVFLKRSVIIKEITYQNVVHKNQILKEINNQVILESYTEYIPFIHNVFVNDKKQTISIEMSKVIGTSLRDLISQIDYSNKSSIPFDDLLFNYKRICSTLSRLHKLKGFVHKDLKPENIIINSMRNAAYIIDFGTSGPGLGKGVGTVGYMAPEQNPRWGKYHVCQATDVFALGQIGIEMFTGKVLSIEKDLVFNPLPSENKWKKDTNIDEFINGLCPKLGTVLKKSIAMDPQERYPNATVLYSALKSIKSRK